MGLSDKRLYRLQRLAANRKSDEMHLYRFLQKSLWLPFRLSFRPLVEGRENLPEQGGVVLAANHRSFFDSFFQGLVLDRPIHWMAKSELFSIPGIGLLLVRLGAFPVVRGSSDQGAISVAEELLSQGELVAVFPEGTRVREGLGEPRRGAARLAGETHSPVVPMAIVGTEKGVLRRSLWHQGERVRMSIGEAIPPPLDTSPQGAEQLTREVIWPEVQERVGILEKRRKEAIALGALSAAATLSALLYRRRRR